MKYVILLGGALLLAACQGNQIPYVEDQAAIGTGLGAAVGATTGGLASTALGAGAGYVGAEAIDELGDEPGPDSGIFE